MTARICEVESYVGENDRACHAAKGKTKRCEVMFGEAGHAYVYLIYGMYHCLNIVTERIGFPAAVLVRGAKWERKELLDGPGKLCRAMHITRAQNGEDLAKAEKLFVVDDGFVVPASDVRTTPRIGVDYAGEDAKLPWRYAIRSGR